MTARAKLFARVMIGATVLLMADRLDAIGGTLDVRSAPGRGTNITGSLPTPEVDA